MSLLKPSVVKDLRQEEITRQLLRAKETDEIVKKNNQRLAQSEADFQSMLARNRLIWADEEKEHSERFEEMKKEIEVLEERKKQALIPIEMYKAQADTIFSEATNVLKRAMEREDNASHTQELLEEKLTDVSEREQDVKKEEARLKRVKEGVNMQAENIKQLATRLSSDIANYKVTREKEETSLLERKKEVALAEINFKAKTDKYARDIEALRVFELQLKDKQATLERSFARLSPYKAK